jgi:hypothetical protein
MICSLNFLNSSKIGCNTDSHTHIATIPLKWPQSPAASSPRLHSIASYVSLRLLLFSAPVQIAALFLSSPFAKIATDFSAATASHL